MTNLTYFTARPFSKHSANHISFSSCASDNDCTACLLTILLCTVHNSNQYVSQTKCKTVPRQDSANHANFFLKLPQVQVQDNNETKTPPPHIGVPLFQTVPGPLIVCAHHRSGLYGFLYCIKYVLANNI